MSRTLRSTSSAQTSPSSKSSNFTESTTYTPSVTPRKAPHCTKCKRPRAGHPRSGCPYVDSPKADQPSNSVASDVGIGLTDALGSMQIASAPVALVREREEETKATIRNRRRLSAQPQLPTSDSLLSLSTNSSEIVARLLQPGMFDDTTDEENASGRKAVDKKIVRWQETLAIPTTPRAEPALKNNKGKGRYSTRSPMPCTLDTPETSFASSTNSVSKQGIAAIPQVESPVEEEEEPEATPDESAGPSTVTPTQGQATPPRRAQPLGRSMSLEEREMFISKLTVKSPATIYILPKADIPTVTASATALGFHACAVLSDDAEDPEALLILGQDLGAVKKLFGKVEEENRKHSEQRKGKPRSSLGLKAVAGGAVVGAVGAWAGLAFA
ncbi:uncharacterized protein LACBIDRAFT_292738 [Laccaria bicolor S238N-H82]|uniref:Predicted protein n=1 Tax=Laccaria bicolor (strain S238N-H82 / ATCC MYA-4686) TaxID=486041 RepID=B0CXD9_LACBS|nr:uncharacterized protein LACBIDRAFT_292738 [Laccaria bicolor S238N-H82]EDR12243.1 predicted protein [Laccaria bicolor S238N-H82]|eukprot:XP_001876507.1 predicted protein [Laccaria bicolor S238N-H82]